ncbi:VanZ family protein [Listeria fleischmannii]|uniref:VanZ family protein n=1 Tax=Listeria fleischmannii TaxID=1069827 RepID=UPI0002BBB583|nr:VanZ family protein [Listeria fleischmannii]EMG29359.1 VanZ family protein [Listeria fleischmannii subsp. fleischmannii LU2006-1]
MRKLCLKIKKFWIALSFLCALIIMFTLFKSSSETYDQQTLVPWLDKILAGRPFESALSHISFNYAGSEISIAAKGYSSFIEFFIRKGAHFFTYFIMGGSLFVGVLGVTKKYKWAFSAGLFFPLIFAATDEYHQYLTGGRTPLVQDVILDFVGATVGVTVVFLVIKQLKKRRDSKKITVS